LCGGALVASGVALSLITMRSLTGERARAEAAVRAAAAATQDAERGGAAELRAIEAKVQAAAELRPLNAAVASQVDSTTLLDLLDNEDWWRPYREQFSVVRVIVGDRVLAARGPLAAGEDAAVVTLARRQLLGSARTTSDGKSFVLAATRLSVLPDQEPVLVLGRQLAAPAAPAVVSPQAAGDAHPIPWALAAAFGLGGVSLLVTGRKQGPSLGTGALPVTGAVTVELPREMTRLMPETPPREMTRLMPETPPREMTQLLPQTPPRAMTQLMPPAAAAAPAHDGKVFGRYQLVDRLGEGGMSEIFVAQASGVAGFTRAFVLKRLRKELARDKEAVAQFIDEARLQANLVHSNIVPVFDFGVVDGEYFMTQEYIVGRDLARLMERHQAGLPAPLAYFVAHETLQALAYAHSRHDQDGVALGIVHRDVSPANIMVSNAGEVKLADFGIVKLNSRVSRTQVGMVKGNANFMSPEQARGLPVDARSDLFSLALALYYSLSGELLYSGNNDLEVLYRAASGLGPEDIERLRRLADPAPQILERAMATDPGDRYQSATELADALAVHMGGGRAALTRLMQDLSAAEQQQRRGTA
jgi:hypothetical protein